MVFVRRRPLLRAAVVGGGAYYAGKKAAGQSAGPQQQPQQAAAPPPSGPAGRSVADQLREITALHEQHALSDEEFQAAKARILAS